MKTKELFNEFIETRKNKIPNNWIGFKSYFRNWVNKYHPNTKYNIDDLEGDYYDSLIIEWKEELN